MKNNKGNTYESSLCVFMSVAFSYVEIVQDLLMLPTLQSSSQLYFIFKLQWAIKKCFLKTQSPLLVY